MTIIALENFEFILSNILNKVKLTNTTLAKAPGAAYTMNKGFEIGILFLLVKFYTLLIYEIEIRNKKSKSKKIEIVSWNRKIEIVKSKNI